MESLEKVSDNGKINHSDLGSKVAADQELRIKIKFGVDAQVEDLIFKISTHTGVPT